MEETSRSKELRGGPRPAGGDPGEPIPLPQRLLDSPFLLLAAGIAVMLVFYTAWGLFEIFTLPPAPLP
jgi:hypothetical protein